MGYPAMIVLVVGLLSAASQLEAAERCSGTQAQMNNCVATTLAKADADLNRYYKAQMAYLTTPAKQQALKDAQRKWLAFRDADCLYQNGKPEDSGTIWPLLDAQCKATLTEQRAAQLKAFSQCRKDGCPR